jgi:hypothetical protein
MSNQGRSARGRLRAPSTAKSNEPERRENRTNARAADLRADLPCGAGTNEPERPAAIQRTQLVAAFTNEPERAAIAERTRAS